MQKVPCDPQVGADIEAFVYDKQKGRYLPCVGLLPGTKDDPHPIPDLPEGYAVQEDNVMAEFNIPPVTTYPAFLKVIQTAKAGVNKMLPPHHSLKFRSALNFPPKDLTSPQAQLYGCDPDFDAYTGGKKRAPFGENVNWRASGGHIHLGGNFNCPDFVAALFADLFIGISCNLRPSATDKRALFYGRPGIYRPKPYGIEYRSPSSVWAGNNTTTEIVGAQAVRLARWLSKTDAVQLQECFQKYGVWMEIQRYWTRQPQCMSKNQLIRKARDAGIPV